jgi:hypothetical protein
MGSLTSDPWEVMTPPHLQAILDQVFGEGKYDAVEEKVWLGLVREILHSAHQTTTEGSQDELAPSLLA